MALPNEMLAYDDGDVGKYTCNNSVLYRNG